MILRLILILSLIAQQALAFSCCGVQMLRPDIVRPDSRSLCAAIGTCTMETSPVNAVEIQAESCCSEDQTSCTATSDQQTPGKGDPDECTPPLDQKEQGPHAQSVDFVAMVAHPLLAPALSAFEWQRAAFLWPLPRWFSHHQRQATLSVWLN